MTERRRAGASREAVARATKALAESGHERPRLAVAAGVPPFDFLESRIQVPPVRALTVPRRALVNRLRATTSAAVATVVAPAGYGKTTLLAQWAARDARPFVWVTVDDRDNDPVVLLRHVAAALDRHAPLDARVLDALRAPGPSIWTAALPRLAAALGACGRIVLVLDDVNLVRTRASVEALGALVADGDDGPLVVVAGRAQPRLPLASLRAAGRLVELGAADLAMTRREAELLLRATGVRVGEQLAEELERCEGWPAAIYLAALSIRDGVQSSPELPHLRGDDRYVADYFRSEYLSRLRPGRLRFLRRVSVLDRMCGPLCDAVLDAEGSGSELESIERANLFVVPLDNRRVWFRYHRLFRDLLHRELLESEPELVPVLHGRAADWFQTQGDDESALEHALAGGDTERAAAILTTLARPVYHSGRAATVDGWLRRFDTPRLLERYPAVAVQGAVLHAAQGRAEDAERWLDAATRGDFSGTLPDGSTSLRPWIALLRAWLCREGVEQMLADAEAALDELPEASSWRPGALVAQGAALMLLGFHERADAALAAVAECAAAAPTTEPQAIALAERVLLAHQGGDDALAEELFGALDALVTASAVEGPRGRALYHAAAMRVMLTRGRWNDARAQLTAAEELLPFLTGAVPWLAVQVRLELVQGLVTLRKADEAARLLDEVAAVLVRAPGLEILARRADDLRREVAEMPEPPGMARTGLTPAELRVLPLLATHLSFREIAEELSVSRNTIKTQAISVYRKLGASSRSEAIAEAHRLGLGDHLRVQIADDR